MVQKSTGVSKVGRNKFRSGDRLVDIFIHLWEWFSEVLALCRCDTRQKYAFDNNQAALVDGSTRKRIEWKRHHTSSFRTSRIRLNILAPDKDVKKTTRAKRKPYHLQYSNRATLYRKNISHWAMEKLTMITYKPLCITKTYLPLRCWGLKKSCSSNSTCPVRPFDAMKDSAAMRVAGRSWTINFLISGYLNFRSSVNLNVVYQVQNIFTWLQVSSRAFLGRLLHRRFHPFL